MTEQKRILKMNQTKGGSNCWNNDKVLKTKQNYLWDKYTATLFINVINDLLKI